MPPELNTAQTSDPSVTGVADANELSGRRGPGFCSNTCLSQSSCPLLRSTQITWQNLPRSVVEVMKMRSPNTIGDDQPSPGISVFQATFSVPLQCSGKSLAAETPWPVGPRNRGQFSTARDIAATAKNDPKTAAASAQRLDCMIRFLSMGFAQVQRLCNENDDCCKNR